MRVRIVCYEDVNAWILGKFALKLQEELRHLSVAADIAKTPDPSADINHHIIYVDYDGKKSSIDTVMITHIDADWKFRKLKQVMQEAALGICMSADSVRLLSDAGIPAEKLCYVNPAHDGLLRPRPYVIGLFSRIYPDGRKREWMLLRLVETISPSEFTFRIMGEGWDEVVKALIAKGFTVEYYPDFDLQKYLYLVENMDYYLNMGMDEGAMAFVDALAAGVPTITTPQGYHLDVPGGLTHPFETEKELLAIFKGVAEQKRSLVRSVATWTWRDYTIKHLQIWQYLLTGEKPDTPEYSDGLATVRSCAVDGAGFARQVSSRFKFVRSSIRNVLGRR